MNPTTWGGRIRSSVARPPQPPGRGNISADPRFVNTLGSDFRLRPDSPCIHTGTNTIDTPSPDALGTPRILDGNRDGFPRVDMGAYEFDPEIPFITRYELTSGGLQLSWLPAEGGFRLQRPPELPGLDWLDVPASVGTNAITLPTADATVLRILTTGGTLKGDVAFAGNPGSVTITNARLVARLGAATNFTLSRTGRESSGWPWNRASTGTGSWS